MARSDAGWVVATATLRDPYLGELAMAADYAASTARATVDYQLNFDTFDVGEYSTLGQGEDAHEYVGCQITSLVLGGGIMSYILDYVWVGGIIARYVRCNSGSQCREMDVAKARISPPQETFPLYVRMKVLWYNNAATICTGFDVGAETSCQPDIIK
jgi:hypothetical protein